MAQSPKTIGEHIKKRRLEKNLLQRETAEIIGLNECTIQNWEMNHSAPKVMYVPKIIDFLVYVQNVLRCRDNSLGEKVVFKRRMLGLSQKNS